MRIVGGLLIFAAAQLALAQQPPPVFPAQMRAPPDPAIVARGSQLYGGFCRACHGADLRGGDMGGPNLLRSQLVLNDQEGEAIGPVIVNGRSPPGGTAMPPMPLPAADLTAISLYIHGVIRTAQPQGAPPPGEAKPLNILVGNARAGQRYFQAQCSGCHSATGDLAGIATRVANPENLQNTWVAGRRFGAPASTSERRQASVTVRWEDGRQESGRLQRLDDFVVSYVTDSGEYRSFTRRHAVPRIASVTVQDPLEQHRRLLSQYTDRNMHDVTAYLATLK